MFLLPGAGPLGPGLILKLRHDVAVGRRARPFTPADFNVAKRRVGCKHERSKIESFVKHGYLEFQGLQIQI